MSEHENSSKKKTGRKWGWERTFNPNAIAARLARLDAEGRRCDANGRTCYQNAATRELVVVRLDSSTGKPLTGEKITVKTCSRHAKIWTCSTAYEVESNRRLTIPQVGFLAPE